MALAREVGAPRREMEHPSPGRVAAIP